MNVTSSNLKDFRRKLKEAHNDLEREVGEVLARFVGEIKRLECELFWQHEVALQEEKRRFDAALRLRHRGAEEWILIELKDDEDPALLVPQCLKFGEQCALFQQKFPDLKVHRLLIIRDDADRLPANLAQECLKQGINLQQFSRLRMLGDQTEALGAEFSLLEYLKNCFNITVRYGAPLTTEVLAVKHSFRGKLNYTFSIPAKTLLPLAYVFRATSAVEPAMEEAYQRSIDVKRLPKIRKFILSDHIASMFPTNIVATIPIGSTAEIRDKGDGTATITLPNEYGALHIIDGQHRLFSLCRATEDEWNVLEGYPFLVTA